MNKVLIYVGLIVLIIVVAVVLATKLTNGLKARYAVAEKDLAGFGAIGETETNNPTESKDTTKGNNNVAENNTKEEPKTDLDKAMDIVKKDWGADEKVYFYYDGIASDGRYIIGVKDSASTASLAWYWVDVENGTFTKE